MDKIHKLWRKHAISREGLKAVVYKDSLGKPTAGIGHLLTKTDVALSKLKVGDKVSKEQIEKWFVLDTAFAREAAQKQAKEIGIEEDWFIVALISVNFQLGAGWIKKFKTTYPAIVNHEFEKAIKNLRKSKWYRQTPVRVNDFIKALQKADAFIKKRNYKEKFKDRPLVKTRTMQGASAATVGTLGAAVAEPIAEAAEKVEALAPYSDGLLWLFILLTLVGIGVTMYGIIDDRKKGYR